ncbi:MAG: glycosyltransferase [Kiritimatiellae bacterium]|nr:glycosyltransferase [Bacteroidales bacterium]MBR3222444.1 glycosyltransferase [Kiritimatiellia bacterium]
MITYNHEPYIRQAIEGVMMQKTDFEFELVIGEDASQDKTREICFEYQRRYSGRIRVLWSEENVFAIAGNETRVTAACRGEYIAFCEGDDYWTDPYKLQKQVAVMRKHPNVGLCFCNADVKNEKTGVFYPWSCGLVFPHGEISGLKFALMHIFGSNPLTAGNDCNTLMTASVLLRRELLLEAKRRFEVFTWNLLLSDTTTWLGLAFLSDVYFLQDKVSVYRRNEGGLTWHSIGPVCRDAMLVRTFFVLKGLNLSLRDVSASFCDNIIRTYYAQQIGKSRKECRRNLDVLMSSEHFAFVFKRRRSFPIVFALRRGWVSAGWLNFFGRLYNRVFKSFSIPKKLQEICEGTHA